MKMTRTKLKDLCTLAKNNPELMKRDFVDVILIDAAFPAAFDEDNMWFLMQQDLLPVVPLERCYAAIDDAGKLLDKWMKEDKNYPYDKH